MCLIGSLWGEPRYKIEGLEKINLSVIPTSLLPLNILYSLPRYSFQLKKSQYITLYLDTNWTMLCWTCRKYRAQKTLTGWACQKNLGYQWQLICTPLLFLTLASFFVWDNYGSKKREDNDTFFHFFEDPCALNLFCSGWFILWRNSLVRLSPTDTNALAYFNGV